MSGQSSAVRAALVIAGGWLFLFWLGHPLPFVDDLRFVGASIHLVEAGSFYNPYCPALKLVDPYPEFFAYMPIQGFALAGWLEVFGISRFSFASFQCLAAALATMGLWMISRRFTDSLLLPLGLVAVVEVFLGSTGLRPEAMGLALVAWGWVLLETTSIAAWFFGGFFLATAVFTSPNVAAVVPAILAWIFVRSYKEKTWARLGLEIGVLAASAAVAFLLFLAAIHFELARFLVMFKATRDQSPGFMNPGLVQSLMAHPIHWRDAARDLLQTYSSVIILVIVTGVLIFRRGLFEIKPSVTAIVFLWVGAAFLFVPMLSSAAGKVPMCFYAILVCLILAVNVRNPFRGATVVIWFALFLIFLFGFGHRTLQLLGRPEMSEAQAGVARKSVAQSGPGPCYIDEFALSGVYDYRMPENGLDYHFGLTDKVSVFAPNQFPPGATLVISKETLVRVHAYEDYPALGPSPRLMPGIGRFFPLKLANPFDIVVVPGGH